MKCREYMETHETENLSWCKPYVAKDGSYAVLWEGKLLVDGEELEGDALEAFARKVNPEYELCKGWPDLVIALGAMTQVGCSECPYNGNCDAMDEEMEG